MSHGCSGTVANSPSCRYPGPTTTYERETHGPPLPGHDLTSDVAACRLRAKARICSHSAAVNAAGMVKLRLAVPKAASAKACIGPSAIPCGRFCGCGRLQQTEADAIRGGPLLRHRTQ